jgi:hypothetical protein
MSDYLTMVARKLAMTAPTGITERVEMPAGLFPHQAALFKRVKDDGRADAALLAWWGSRFGS